MCKPLNLSLKKKYLFGTLFLVTSALYFSCDFPYKPVPEPGIVVQNTENADSRIRVFQINGTDQICNPSISQDTDRFPGCMLWLNFDGELPVKIPEEFKDFAGFSSMHDRLTIVDTSNTVRWYVKLDEIDGVSEVYEFQDPEWSTHPEYIISLLGAANKIDGWSCYIFHPQTGKKLKISNEGLFYNSTPHLWVEKHSTFDGEPDEVDYDDDSFINSEAVMSYFGTLKVKVVVSKLVGKVQSLYYRDFSDTNRQLEPLIRPANRDGWHCESPLISPDGQWIAYNVISGKKYATYIQKLSTESKPILFKEGALDPHWWVHPFDSTLLYLIYQEVPGSNLVTGDLADTTYLTTGELGKTYRQQLRLFPDTDVELVALTKIGEPELLVNLPTKGGLSPDGKYLCTGFDRAFMVGLP